MLRMRFWVELRDATLKDILPSHLQESGNPFVLVLGNIPKHEIFRLIVTKCFAIDHCYGIGIEAIVKVAHKKQLGAYVQLVPYLVNIVILTTSQMAVHVVKFSCLHNSKFL